MSEVQKMQEMGHSSLRMTAEDVSYDLERINSRDAVLDVLAEDRSGKLYSLEIQRRDTIDHGRRARFYNSMIDSEYLEKGKPYFELPEVHIIYISETDLWKAGKTTYQVEKHFKGTDIPYEDGTHVLYVNAAVDDDTETARLMKYFKTADPEDMSQGGLSKRVHFLKCEEGGFEVMCEVSEKIYQYGIQEGILEGEIEKAKKTALNMAQRGFATDMIAELVEVSADLVRQWIGKNTIAESGDKHHCSVRHHSR